jgi:ribosomal protein S14
MLVRSNLRWLKFPGAAHPNAKLNANCVSEQQTMNYLKGPWLTRNRIEYSFGALVHRTLRDQRREERRLAEQRGTKHQFQARNSCILDGRNYRIARRLLSLARAQFE